MAVGVRRDPVEDLTTDEEKEVVNTLGRILRKYVPDEEERHAAIDDGHRRPDLRRGHVPG